MQPDLESFALTERQRLVGLAFILTGRRDQAEDVVQGVFARLLSKDLSGVENLNLYARRAVVNECASWRRSVLRRDRLVAQLGDLSHEAIAPAMFTHVDLSKALGRLSSKLRTVVVLRYYMDMDDEAIAAVADCAPSTVRSRLSRALAKLRSELDPEE